MIRGLQLARDVTDPAELDAVLAPGTPAPFIEAGDIVAHVEAAPVMVEGSRGDLGIADVLGCQLPGERHGEIVALIGQTAHKPERDRRETV